MLILIIVVGLLTTTSTTFAASEDMITTSKSCYAASIQLAETSGAASEHALLRNHLMENALPKLGIMETTARIDGDNALSQAALMKGVTKDKMALDLFNQVCKPIFFR